MTTAVAIAEAPAKRPLGPRKAEDIPKQRRISRLVREACALLADGQVKTITDAAKRLNCRREHLSRHLAKEHVQAYLQHEAKRKISRSVLRAAHVKVDLLDCDSDKVRNDVASDILAIGGIAPPRGAGITINNTMQFAGYVIDLSGNAPVDVTPEPERG